MRFMVIMYPGPSAEAETLPDPATMEQKLAAMGAFNEELVNAGVILAGEGLHPSRAGARVRWSGGQPIVSDGPFTEAREIVGGFWLWQCKSREEAIAWATRIPADDDQMIEIRRVFEAEDFGEGFTPELREAEDRMRDQIAEQAAKR